MSQAFALAGYDNARLQAIYSRRCHRATRDRLLADVVASSNGLVSIVQATRHWRPQLRLQSGLLVSVYVLHCFETKDGEVRWSINVVPREQEFITFIARLATNDVAVQDFFVLPHLRGRTRWTLSLHDEGLKMAMRLSALSEFAGAVNQML